MKTKMLPLLTPSEMLREEFLTPMGITAYRLAKDLRSKLAIGDVDRVLEGDLEPFMHAFLVWRKTGRIAGDDHDEQGE